MKTRNSRNPLTTALMAIAVAAGTAITFMIPMTPRVAGQQQPATAPTAVAAPFPVTISVDASQSRGALKPIYRFFGADEPNYAYMKDGVKLLNDIGALGKPQAFFRAHNMMTTGDGTPSYKWGSTNMYTEDAAGNPVYDWTISDRIIEAYLKNNVKPYMQLGFMPKAMSEKPDPYQHNWSPGQPYGNIYTGWAYPPKDYNKWRELCFQWVKHCVEKYGKAEVEQWYWETWNEANAGSPQNGTSRPTNGAYWMGSAEEFRKLHDYAIDGVKRALPTAKVGGPDTAGPGGNWMRAFLEHQLRGTNFATGKVGTPIDFIAFHAKGSPDYVDSSGRSIPRARLTTPGIVRTGISNQLRAINDGFAIVASFPELKNTPIVIGESDPDGCAGCQATVYPENGYRNTEQYASYTAASFVRKHDLADRHGVNLEGALTWAFEFENEPVFAGFRVMNTNNGINLPVFNVFRMFGKMTGNRIAATSSGQIELDQVRMNGVRGDRTDVGVMASLDANKLAVFVWHYYDDYSPGPDAAISLALKALPAAAQRMQMTHYRIDNTHTNPYTAWQKMGSPKEPSEAQYEQLRAAGQLATLGAPTPVTATNGAADVKFNLPKQGVSLLVLTW